MPAGRPVLARRRRRLRPLAEQVLEVEPFGEHRERAVRVRRPFRLRPVAVELDAVPVGIVKVEGLADAVVAGAGERDAGRDQPAERVGERRPARVEDGVMIEAGRAGRRRVAALALPGVEADVVMVVAGGDEGGVLAVARLQREAEDAAIEGERPLDVGDLEVGVADADARIDGPGEKRRRPSSRRGCLRLTCGGLLPGTCSRFL